MQIYWNKSSNPTGLVWDTNMVTIINIGLDLHQYVCHDVMWKHCFPLGRGWIGFRIDGFGLKKSHGLCIPVFAKIERIGRFWKHSGSWRCLRNNRIPKLMIKICCWRLFEGTETVSCRLSLWMARMEMDWNLKKLANFDKIHLIFSS